MASSDGPAAMPEQVELPAGDPWDEQDPWSQAALGGQGAVASASGEEGAVPVAEATGAMGSSPPTSAPEQALSSAWSVLGPEPPHVAGHGVWSLPSGPPVTLGSSPTTGMVVSTAAGMQWLFPDRAWSLRWLCRADLDF